MDIVGHYKQAGAPIPLAVSDDGIGPDRRPPPSGSSQITPSARPEAPTP